MGDIHVHTAPHDYEEGGYDVWYWGDSTFALLFLGLAVVEGAVANAMHRRKRELGGWQDVRGGQLWWGRKFMFLCALLPVTLLRAGNLWVWAQFNGEAETGEMSASSVDALKLRGDWLNGVCCWGFLGLKGIFLLTWGEVTRSSGDIRWNEIYRQLAAGLAILALVLGLPQALVVHYGRVCQTHLENDFCRKYRDTMSSLAFTQAAVGLVFGGVFGRVAWRWSHAANQGGYSELSSNEQAHLFAAGNRDSYGSTGGSDAEGVSPGEQENAFILIDATTYAGAAHCVFFSLLAHAAFNVYFAWYATGGLGLLGNQPLVILTLLKLLAVEFAPFAWITLTIYADALCATRSDPSFEMHHPGGAATGGGGGGGSGSGSGDAKGHWAEEEGGGVPPPASAYQIE